MQYKICMRKDIWVEGGCKNLSLACGNFRVFWKMKPSTVVSALKDLIDRRSCFCSLFPTASLFFLGLFLGSSFIANDQKEKVSKWDFEDSKPNRCENRYRARGIESLPDGIVSKTSNLELRPLWGYPKKKADSSIALFAIAVGMKQKEEVNKMVTKFLSSNFAVMLFHYDGNVDGWKDLEWADQVVHVSAVNQTKWWFAKRFLHPDIVAAYRYIFLWDEDLGVEYFNPTRYISIVKGEGLEISQPALDPTKSEVHHQITARWRRSKVHWRTYKPGAHGIGCDYRSKNPPCTGWIELMAPVFSSAAWRCVWHMIQNDLIHAWGLDMMLGYCAQGDRTKKIGVVDAEYIIHYGLPTLGESGKKTNSTPDGSTSEVKNLVGVASPASPAIDYRIEVRRESYNEYKVFMRRWRNAAKRDRCWIDPYPETMKQSLF